VSWLSKPCIEGVPLAGAEVEALYKVGVVESLSLLFSEDVDNSFLSDASSDQHSSVSSMAFSRVRKETRSMFGSLNSHLRGIVLLKGRWLILEDLLHVNFLFFDVPGVP